MLELYQKFYLDKGNTSIGLFRELKKKYGPKRVLYPGSYVHITLSLVFSDVTYIDSVKKTDKFFDDLEVRKLIDDNKEYDEKASIVFYHQDYFKSIPEKDGAFDLIFSHYGGIACQATKKYLKKGGYLVCNDSHGEASMASLDDIFEFVGVYKRISDDEFKISENGLDKYFIPKKDIKFSKKSLNETMKGIVYTESPSGYIFRKR